MTNEGWLGLGQLLLILSALPCCWSLQVSIPQAEYEVANGDDIILPCSFVPANPNEDFFVLSWEAASSDSTNPMKPVATYFSNKGQTDIAPGYEGRALLSVDAATRESTLRLNKVTEQDSRTYQCSVLIPRDDEGNTAATTSVLVLERPSKPICRVQGTAEYWNNISLTCLSEKGSPKPTYAWQTYSVQNTPRNFPPRTTEKNGVLSLFNISMETSGFFICTSTNKMGSASCNMTLSVMPPSMNIGATAGIIGGILAGILCLGIAIYCCCKKKDKKEKYAEGSPAEMEFHDRATPEPGEKYRDDNSNIQTKANIEQLNQVQEKAVPQQNSYADHSDRHKFEDDQHSYVSGKEGYDGKGSNADNRHHLNDQDRYSDSRDRYGGSRDRYGGSRDRLDDDWQGGSRDRLDDQRNRYGGSRDRLDDRRDRYGGSHDRLDDQRDRYGGSRDRLDDQRDRYGGSRDRLDDQRNRYGGSRDRLDYKNEHVEHYQYRDRYD